MAGQTEQDPPILPIEKLKIFSFNIQSMAQKKRESLNELEHRNVNVGIGIFAEARTRPQEHGESFEDGDQYIFLNNATTVRGVAGISLAVRRSLRYALTDWGTHKDRIIWADFKVGKISFRVVGVYMPTARKKFLPRSQKLYDQLQKLCRKGTVFIAGDFNARLPQAATDCHWGKFGNCNVQIENKNSPLLSAFCRENGFRSLASKFRKSGHGYATWEHPNPSVHRKHHQIDHFLCKGATARAATNCSVIHEALPDSDHKPILIEVDIKPWKWYPKPPPQKTTMAYSKKPEVKKVYNAKVKDALAGGISIKDAIAEAASDTFKCRVPSSTPWRSEKYVELAVKKRDLLRQGAKKEAKKLRLEMRRQDAIDERAHYEKICEEVYNKYKKSGSPPTMQDISKHFGKKAKKRPAH